MKNTVIFVPKKLINILLTNGLLAVFFALLLSCGPEVPEKVQLVNLKRKIALIAHRGASGAAPENTLAAVKKALQTSAEFIEIDVHQTKDGQVVLMHDANVDRTTNGKGNIADLTLAKLKELDAGSWYDSAYAQERVPTLAEVLQLVKGKKKLLIEVKKGADYYPDIEKNIISLIQKNQAQNWCIIQSFYDEVLQKVWKSEFAVPTHKLIVGKMPWMPLYYDHGLRWGSLEKYYRASAINVHQYFATESFIKHVHNNGFKTYVWTVDDPEEINEIINRGADGIMSNAVASLEVEK